MRKILTFEDGVSVDLSPLTFQEFMAIDLWSGASDMAWEAWLRKNDFHEADSYRSSSLKTAHFSLSNESLGDLLFNPSGDGETWVAYDPESITKSRCIEMKRDEQ